MSIHARIVAVHRRKVRELPVSALLQRGYRMGAAA